MQGVMGAHREAGMPPKPVPCVTWWVCCHSLMGAGWGWVIYSSGLRHRELARDLEEELPRSHSHV